jgi:hypothetical protein
MEINIPARLYPLPTEDLARIKLLVSSSHYYLLVVTVDSSSLLPVLSSTWPSLLVQGRSCRAGSTPLHRGPSTSITTYSVFVVMKLEGLEKIG